MLRKHNLIESSLRVTFMISLNYNTRVKDLLNLYELICFQNT